MIRFLLFFWMTCFISLSSANYYAVEICASLNQNKLIEDCKSNNYSIQKLSNEGFFFIELPNEFNLDVNSCFVSEVKLKENHFAFNTNTLMVKMKASNQERESYDYHTNPFPLVAHAIIPNLYSTKLAVNNMEELLVIKNEIAKSELVEYVGIKQVFTLQASTNDALYDRQWSIENNGTAVQVNGTPDADMQVDSAWNLSQGSSSIKIAILDSGVDTLHEDLLNNLLPGFDGYATDSTDTKGFPTPNFSNDGHGTACAGIAAAEANNNIGVAGIAYLCKIIPIRIFYYQNYGGQIGIQATTNTDALITGSAHAWRVADADVMSTSAGLSPLFISALGVDPTLVTQEINEAYWSGRSGYGVPMFFSAGNDDFNDVLWPGDLPTTIAVGASTMCDERKNPNDCSPESWGSSYGVSLDLVAPGVRIASTDMMGASGYSSTNYTSTFNGTSASCPNAAGVGALILSLSPGLHARDVKAILNSTADRVGGYAYDSTTIHGTWNEEMGHGRVNAYKALQLAQTYESTVGVGIRELPEVVSFSIYPNPSEGTLTIENLMGKEDFYEIYNMEGRMIQGFFTSNVLTRIELELTTGIYFVKSIKHSTVLKIIVE